MGTWCELLKHVITLDQIKSELYISRSSEYAPGGVTGADLPKEDTSASVNTPVCLGTPGDRDTLVSKGIKRRRNELGVEQESGAPEQTPKKHKGHHPHYRVPPLSSALISIDEQKDHFLDPTSFTQTLECLESRFVREDAVQVSTDLLQPCLGRRIGSGKSGVVHRIKKEPCTLRKNRLKECRNVSPKDHRGTDASSSGDPETLPDIESKRDTLSDDSPLSSQGSRADQTSPPSSPRVETVHSENLVVKIFPLAWTFYKRKYLYYVKPVPRSYQRVLDRWQQEQTHGPAVGGPEDRRVETVHEQGNNGARPRSLHPSPRDCQKIIEMKEGFFAELFLSLFLYDSLSSRGKDVRHLVPCFGFFMTTEKTVCLLFEHGGLDVTKYFKKFTERPDPFLFDHSRDSHDHPCDGKSSGGKESKDAQKREVEGTGGEGPGTKEPWRHAREKVRRFEVIVFQLLYALDLLQREFYFKHNDINKGNVLVQQTGDPPVIQRYQVWDDIQEAYVAYETRCPVSFQVKLIDFEWSTVYVHGLRVGSDFKNMVGNVMSPEFHPSYDWMTILKHFWKYPCWSGFHNDVETWSPWLHRMYKERIEANWHVYEKRFYRPVQPPIPQIRPGRLLLDYFPRQSQPFPSHPDSLDDHHPQRPARDSSVSKDTNQTVSDAHFQQFDAFLDQISAVSPRDSAMKCVH